MRLAPIAIVLACAGEDAPPPRKRQPPDPWQEALLLEPIKPQKWRTIEELHECITAARLHANRIAYYLAEHEAEQDLAQRHRELLDAAALWEQDLRRLEVAAFRARWQAEKAQRAALAPPPEPAPTPKPPPPAEPPRAKAPPIRCPRCGARPGRWCRGPNGGPVPTIHPERLRARSKS